MPKNIVIFGASGDLTRRKLIPALYNLWLCNKLPNIRIFGMARTNFTDAEWVEFLAQGQDTGAKWAQFARLLSYVAGDATKDVIPDGELYYLAVHPSLYGAIAKRIMENVKHPIVPRKLILEKPFGTSLATAQELNKELYRYFREDQLYRIDHYLGKETVQNLLVFRFANAIFEPIWSRDYIDHVQITAAESEGIGTRAGYYDQSGVLRDMFQNHLLQLLTLVAMEAPSSLEDIRAEKLKLLRAIPTLYEPQLKESLHGQYDGYRTEPGVHPGSMNPTFGCAKFTINNWRWTGVPFYLRSGKALKERTTRIVIQFKQVPHSIFHNASPNRLVIKIQPEESIRLHFTAKVPGWGAVGDKNLLFQYGEAFPDAYQTLLLDAINGNKSLFTSAAETEEGWRIVDPIRNHWALSPLYRYEVGSWGPAYSNELLTKDGRRWL